MRFEYKYVVPINLLESIRKEISNFTIPDTFVLKEMNNEYVVRSIYFDTPHLSAYFEKIEGVRNRRKLRIRSYNNQEETNNVFLEIKSKIDQRGTKHRAVFNFRDLPELFKTKEIEKYILSSSDKEIAIATAQRFLFNLIRSSMKPVVLVTYNREAFQGRFDNSLRITFDKKMRYLPFPYLKQLYEEETLRDVFSKYFIIEIKFNDGYAQWLQSIINKYNLTRQSISKYGLCIESSKEINPMLIRRFNKSETINRFWQAEVTV